MKAWTANRAFWQGRRVLVTGHTGFKGSWLTLCLKWLGARVDGLALPPDTDPSLHNLTGLAKEISGGNTDIRNKEAVHRLVQESAPQIVIHMAAQPLVRRSVRAPLPTFDTNVMGTAYLLEALRSANALEAVLVITTDKVYGNSLGRPFQEEDPLGAHDPYSSSKAATEIIASCYAQTFFDTKGIPIATARSGNVIGGGDFSEDRLVPDIYRAMTAGEPLVIRNPNATRPWHHVLDCACGYLAYVEALVMRQNIPRALNFAPAIAEQVPVILLAEAMQAALGVSSKSNTLRDSANEPVEVQELTLNATRAHEVLGWQNKFDSHMAIKQTAEWYLAMMKGDDMGTVTRQSVDHHLSS